jgi:hypothetical protein
MWTTMTDPVADTLAYYDRKAEDFAEQTIDLDLGPLYGYRHPVRLSEGSGAVRFRLSMCR